MRPSTHLEHAWLDAPDTQELGTLYATKHHPRGAAYRFDEGVVRELVATWQRDPRPELLAQILEAARPVLTGTLLGRGDYSANFDELMNDLRVKIWRKLAKYDPANGRVFTFISLIAGQALSEAWAKKRLHQTRYNPTGLESLDHR